jgi:Pentapeptide repeats (9 copies)
MCVSELRSGYMKQNSGLIAGELAQVAVSDVKFDSMYFEKEVLRASRLDRAEFRRCVFNDLVIVDCEWTDCNFKESEVLGITVQNTRLDGCLFDGGCRVVGVLDGGGQDEGFRTYVPENCERILTNCGAQFPKSTLFPRRQPVPPVSDDRRQALEKFLRIFERNTGAVESVIQLKLGRRLSVLEKEILPMLLKHEVIRQTPYRGRGAQNRYELCFPLETILQAEDPESPAPTQLINFWQELRS